MTAPRVHALGLLAALAVACAPTVKQGPLTQYERPASRPAVPAKKAADTDHWKGRTDLIRTPPRQAAAALTLPAALRRQTLKNGLTLLLLPDDQLPLFGATLLLPTGSIDDPAGRVGLAEFVAGMLRQGTRKYDADALSRVIDAQGMSLEASASYEHMSVGCSGRARTQAQCLELLAEVALRPSFAAKELDEERKRLIGDVKEALDRPAALARMHLDNRLYGDDHPGGRPMTVEGLTKITREELVKFHKARFRPRGAVLVLNGSFDADKVTKLAQRQFGRWQGSAPARRQHPAMAASGAGLHVLLVDKPNLTQSFLALGHAGIKRTHPATDAIRVMNYVLGGGGFSSRLMQVVRAEGGKTYGVSSSFDSHADDGAFMVRTFTRTAQTVATLKLVVSELERMARKPPTTAEIAEAKGYIAGAYPMQFQTPSHVAMQLGLARLRKLPDSWVTEFALRIDKLSEADVAQAARAHVRAKDLVATIVGRASAVAPLLRAAKIPFTTVSYLDPISAAERARAKSSSRTPIDPAQLERARSVLQRGIVAAGGAARLFGLKSLRLIGRVKMARLEGSYMQLVLPPDHLRQQFSSPMGEVTMVLAGQRAFVRTPNGPRQALPEDKRLELRRNLWRDPTLVLRHASQPGVTLRPVATASKGRTAIEASAPGQPPTTLVFDTRTHKLVELRYQGARSELRIELAEHTRLPSGLVVAQRIVQHSSGLPPQTIRYTRIEVNPRLTAADVVGP